MDVFSAMQVSASALEAQKKRMNVIASNMANVQSTRTESGGPYRKKDVVFAALDMQSDPVELTGVKVVDVVESEEPFKLIHDPSHPDADQQGVVALPNISIIEEMVNMMMAYRAYEASVNSFNMSKSMYLKALELGRQ